MNLTYLDHFVLLSQLSRPERVSFAAHCAQIAVRVLAAMSLPISFKEITAVEEVVRLVERSAAGSGNLAELDSAMQNLRHLAFNPPTQCKFLTDTVICQIAHAAYAAGQTVFTGSSVDAQDSLEAALAAARAAESKEAQDSLWEEMRRVRRAAIEAAGTRMRMGYVSAQADQIFA
jgi:hypothetical protein